MQPMSGSGRGWPEGLGQPASSGARGGTRPAFFPEARRPLAERDGEPTTHDGGDHRIGGVSQGGQGQPPSVSVQNGPVQSDESEEVG